MAKKTKPKYSFWIGIKKTLKNWLVLWAPAVLAFLASVPVEYGALAGAAAYLVKNYIKNK